jgi:hypothetical protein
LGVNIVIRIAYSAVWIVVVVIVVVVVVVHDCLVIEKGAELFPRNVIAGACGVYGGRARLVASAGRGGLLAGCEAEDVPVESADERAEGAQRAGGDAESEFHYGPDS